jgi:hypothetical protein
MVNRLDVSGSPGQTNSRITRPYRADRRARRSDCARRVNGFAVLFTDGRSGWSFLRLCEREYMTVSGDDDLTALK